MTRGTDDFYGTVVRREQLTPSLVRVVLGGPGMAGWGAGRPDATDAYFVLRFPPAGAPYAAPFSVAQVEAEHPRALWPAHRHYSVRAWDAVAEELSVDFVVHGDSGLAGPWARDAQVGDQVVLSTSHGSHRPDPGADWHLLVGDEAALPAIAASLEVLPAGARAIAILVCDGAEHELELSTPASLEVQWLHRTGDPSDADLLVDAVRSLDFPDGRVHGFVHGEAGEVREVRRHLLGERQVPRADLSVSGYWRRTMTDEAWRRVKRDWNAEVESDVPTA
ncbi:siderophore-interacting protein [Nocardioides hwasunensis]|uniref:siderophore-interacting protein n=1 Tax=Nocardioides hwasunensis TaxID=397258 RepID=UPI0029655E87|nr:siderophore-interacting protein [Nocardioides hwasunensis]